MRTFIIAEIGNNHEGNFKNAKDLINLAAKAGVDAVKFQTYKTDQFIRKVDKLRFKKLKKFQLSYKDFIKLYKHAKKKKLKFISTPLDFDSLSFLSKNSDMIKIASSDNNFFDFINEALKIKKKIIISTGMLSQNELIKLINYTKILTKKYNRKHKTFFLHCVSSYPAEPKDLNLNSINFLLKKTNYDAGYSDHSIGIEACLAAVTLGAKVIEKHFTIDKNFSNFRDHKISSDFNEMKNLVNSIRRIENMLGSTKKTLSKNESLILKQVRRQPYALNQIKNGDVFSIKNTVFLRTPHNVKNISIEKILNKKSIKNYDINQRISKIK